MAARRDASAGSIRRPRRSIRLLDAVWRPWFARDLPGSRPVIGHGDLGPWNVLACDGLPVAIIDWDYAGPVDAVWELAQLVWLNAQLHDDDVAAASGLPSPEDRATLAAAILDGYGLPGAEREGFVDRLDRVRDPERPRGSDRVPAWSPTR